LKKKNERARACLGLVAELAERLGGGADEADAVVEAGLCERRVLRQEAVACVAF
jgi:hypothetical protein